MIELSDIQKLAENDDVVVVTQHSMKRFRERGIRYDDIIACIKSGEIIEQYPNDFPNPSCLVLGSTCSGKYLHVVCGTDGEYLWIITAYYPSEDKWTSDYKTRKD